jgi:NADH dehydrogenase (ubiquinone) 1 alpha subcomplex subunit 13
MPQDLPPTGGYEPVQYKVSECSPRAPKVGMKLIRNAKQRNLPARGFRPGYMLVAVAGIMTYGFWKLGKGIREQK